MDIQKLQQFIKLSNEDFADAHEPVNDGVKDVPDASDIAAMVGRKGGEGEADITKGGDAKVIPEQDTEEKEESDKPEMTTVKEAEDTPPAKPASTETSDTTEEVDTTEADAESPVEDEPELAHDDVKAVETDEKVTASEKESLEAFIPLIKRAELIGYSKRDTEALTKSIGRVRAKAGVRGAFTVSAESIHETVALAETHLGKLARKRAFLKQRDLRVAKENFVPGSPEVEAQLDQQPLAHEGAVPLNPALAAGITMQEMGPVIDTVIEEQAIANTYQTIADLEQAGVAVEQFTTLLRENKGRISKQAAAIIHTSLEHIDLTCNLRARSTGLENYDTSPRAAMEDAEVNEKSLSSRAGEIGAKILKFLKMLWDRAEDMFKKYTSGITKLESEIDSLLERANKLKFHSSGTHVMLEETRQDMFVGSEFVGYTITKDEDRVVTDLRLNAKRILGTGVGPVVAAMKSGALDDETYGQIEKILDSMSNDSVKYELPGGHSYEREGITVKLTDADADTFPQRVEIRLISKQEMKKNLELMKRHLNDMSGSATMDILRKSNRDLSKGVSDFRGKVKGEENFDEQGFQGFQTEVINKLVKPFDMPTYVNIITKLARMIGPRLFVLNKIYAYHKAEDDRPEHKRPFGNL